MSVQISHFMKSAAEEPYRVFFPTALLVGVLGVFLWPLFYWQVIDYYPLFSHARLMTEGFVGGFAIGFLGTALPKMMQTKSLRGWQLGVLLGLHGVFCGCHLLGYVRVGDALFALMMSLMLFWLFLRVRSRGSLPPPAMVVAGMGLVCGVVGAGISSALGLMGDPYVVQFAQRLLYQAFILLPLLGVGCFIFPMILGTPNKQMGLGGKKASVAWKKKAGEGLLLGGLIVASYWVEVHGKVQMMSWVRFVLSAVWLTKETGWLQRKKAKGVMPFALKAGIVCVLGSMLAIGLLDKQKIALDHMLYIGGFGLITMMVATRVIYGHSGQGAKFQKWMKPVVACVALILLGMATRVSADFIPHLRVSHHIYAAFCWVTVSIIWGIAVLPSVKKYPFPQKLIVPTSAKKPSVMEMNFRK